jgi:uncharacterized protein YjbI with pentapeptide repeats
MAMSPELVLNLSGAKIRRADLSRTNLTRANLRGADCSFATFRGSDFKDAILDGTILIGADLSDTHNLTWAQLSKAIIDDTTILPDNLMEGRVSA